MNLTHLFSSPFLLLINPEGFALNIFGDSVIQSLKSGKTRKSGIVPMSRQERLADLFLVFPARLET